MPVPEKSSVKKISRIALISAALLLLTGCAELPAAAPISPVDYKACVVEEKGPTLSPLADVADYGVKQAVVTYGITRAVVSVTDSKFESAVSKLVKQKCNLLVVTGVNFADQLVSVAKDNATANFVYVSDQTHSDLVSSNVENLVVYSVDSYEAGLLVGYLAAGLTDNDRVLSGLGFVEAFTRGIEDGVSKYSTATSQAIENIRLIDMVPSNGPTQPDVAVSGGFGVTEATNLLVGNEFKWVGFGRDLYNEPSLVQVKNRIAVTVEPRLGGKLLELIASDLEGDFIGGTFGSYHGTFGNGGLGLSPEHDINLPATLLQELKTVANDYEASLKK